MDCSDEEGGAILSYLPLTSNDACIHSSAWLSIHTVHFQPVDSIQLESFSFEVGISDKINL